MTSLVIVYLLIGAISYWPAVHFYMEPDEMDGKWYEWIAAWAVWTVTWPYRYIQDLVYWWRAKK